MHFIDAHVPGHFRRATVLAGKGNNGGDTLVVAGLLATETAIPVTLCTICPLDQLTGDARVFADRLPESVEVVVCSRSLPETVLDDGCFIVDGLLGTGFQGPLRAPYAEIIDQVNRSGRPVIAVDIPSGLDGDSGRVETAAVIADLTVTLALPKHGLVQPIGREHSGRICCVDIGIPAEFSARAEGLGEALFPVEIGALLKRRPAAGHKGTFGHVLVVGGSVDYVGAPLLAGSAALRSGCGLTTVATAPHARQLMSAHPAALILRPVGNAADEFLTAAAEAPLQTLQEPVQAVVLGPGIGRHAPTANIVRQVAGWDKPLVIDADALHFLAEDPQLMPRSAATVLTPHPGEMKALLDGFGLNDYQDAVREKQAVKLAQCSGACIVLKGLGTIVASPSGEWKVNMSGDNTLGTGGTGDVLSGLIAGFLAQGFSAFEAAQVGVCLHGLAAELSVYGRRATIADDLLEMIGQAFAVVTPFN